MGDFFQRSSFLNVSGEKAMTAQIAMLNQMMPEAASQNDSLPH